MPKAMYVVAIKGRMDIATRELERRGIPIHHALIPQRGITRVKVITTALPLTDWLAERCTMIPGYGYPDGTLLHFSEVPS